MKPIGNKDYLIILTNCAGSIDAEFISGHKTLGLGYGIYDIPYFSGISIYNQIKDSWEGIIFASVEC